MYWYFITDEPNPRMWISDAYLPLQMDKEHARKYKFSLFFPVSLLEGGASASITSTTSSDSKNDKKEFLTVTGGEGDFYCVALCFQRDQILTRSFLRHDVTKVDVRNDYHFHRLPFTKGRCTTL
jgi:hypothetical protein